MKLRTKGISILMAIVLCIAMMVPVQTKAEEQTSFDMRTISGKTVILHTNDTHGRIQNGADDSLGMSVVAAMKKACEKAGAEVILLDAGDTLHGKPIATLDKGETITAIMNACGYDAMTLGNHDYNYGADRVKELEKEMDFPILSANVTYSNNNALFVKDHMIITKNGVKYGIFGLSTEETKTKTNPKNVEKLTFSDPAAVAQKQVAALKAEGAEVIIALGHIGIDGSSDPKSSDIMTKVEGIDLFIDGHSHSELASCMEAYSGKGLLVSSGQYLNTLGLVVIDTDKTMKAYALTAEDIKNAGVAAALAEGQDETAIDEKAGKIVVDAQKKLEEALGEVVGTTEVYLDGAREHVRGGETNLGNLAADAIRFAAGADCAMTNGGGIRVSIEKGDITKGMLADVFPFGNIVVSKKVTGRAIKAMLEHGVSAYPDLSGGYPQVSGMSFTVEPNNRVGRRIVNLKINGEPYDLDKEYILASNDFTFAGGDGYTMIGDEAFPKLYEFGALDEELIKYIQTNPSIESYAVGRTTIRPLDGEEEEQPEVTEPDKPDETEEIPAYYIVVAGDNLSKIAKMMFKDATEWRRLFELNKGIIKNPNLIYPGQKLAIE